MEEEDRPPTPNSGGVGEESAEKAVDEPLLLETALSWLAAIRPAALLALLRDPEFALISNNAFVGFRVNAAGYANPLVRRRLAQEILQDDTFAEKVKALAAQSRIAPPPPKPPPPPILGEPEKPPHSRESELKAERDKRRQERDDARQALREAQETGTEATRARRQVEDERDSQARLLQQQAQRIARLERQVAKMHTEQAALLKALRQDKVSTMPRPNRPAPHSPASPELTAGADNPWREAVRHLLHKDKRDAALALALDVLRADPEEQAALDIARRVYESRGETREAAGMARRLVAARLARGETIAVAEALVLLLLLLPPPPDARREVRQWLSHLKGGGGDAVAAGRAALDRLRTLSPDAHDWLAAEVRAAAPVLADELMPTPGALGPDDLLPLPGGWTARHLLDAINAGDESAVTPARKALTALQQTDPDAHERAWSALERVTTEDDSALVPLRRAPYGSVVVDGSNAAWFDQHSLVHPRPRLAAILALRRALRLRGWFPVILYADAPLPYTVDDPAALRAMLGRGEIALVDSGVDADEVLLREAKRWSAPLVTNDYMTDWDPENEVTKIQYTISLTGEAHLLS